MATQGVGHSTSRTTENEKIYARFSPIYLRAASDALDMPGHNLRR